MNTWDIVAKAIKVEIDYLRENTHECHNRGSQLLMFEKALDARVRFVQDIINNLEGLKPAFDPERFGKACGLLEDEIPASDLLSYSRCLDQLRMLQKQRQNVS